MLSLMNYFSGSNESNIKYEVKLNRDGFEPLLVLRLRLLRLQIAEC